MSWRLYQYDRVELHLNDERLQSIHNLKNAKIKNDFSPEFKEKEIPKIYLLKSKEFYLYVGATIQPIHTKLKGGLKGNEKYGYHGYKWKNKNLIECFVWAFNGFSKEQIEAVEAELVYLIRNKYGIWPEYQNEIHFNNKFPLSKDLSNKIFNYLEREYPLQSRISYKKDTDFIFKEPHQYGFRGDPYLWKDLKVRYQYSDIIDLEKFRKLLIDTFIENTGNPPIKDKTYKVKHFSFGGMSSGGVDSNFWLEKEFPLLEERFANRKNKNYRQQSV